MHKIQIRKITNKRLLRQARPTQSAILKIKKKKCACVKIKIRLAPLK